MRSEHGKSIAFEARPELSELRVVHWPKLGAGASSAVRSELGATARTAGPSLEVDTCQRKVRVELGEGFGAAIGGEVWRGESAYEFLLRFACGLESAVVGETDVFGQIKEAWKSQPSSRLSFWMQKLFEDAKEIRELYLRGVGTASYGSLTRRALRERGLVSGNQVLLVGAGALARSVLPFLLDHDVSIVNRTVARSWELADLAGLTLDRSRVKISDVPYGEESIWKNADVVVICVPAVSPAAGPAERIDPLAERWGLVRAGALIVHLGMTDGMTERRNDNSAVPPTRGSWVTLTQLMSQQAELDAIAKERVRRASFACQERARLRALGNSLSIAHGWEDLAVFQCAIER